MARLALTTQGFRDAVAGTSSEGRRLVSLLRWQDKRGDPSLADAPGERGLIHDPLLGWRARPGHTSPGVTIDEDGHRLTPSGNPDAPHVVLLGDSFTFGDEVDDDATFAVQLARATGWRITNAGVPGYGLDQCVLAAERDVLPTHPDAVVLGLTSPMMVRPLATWDVWAKPRFLLQDGALALTGTPLPAPSAGTQHLSALRVVDLARVWVDTLTSPLRDDDARDAVDAALLARLDAATRLAGVPLLVVWLPEVDLLDAAHGTGVDAPFAAWCEAPDHACLAPWDSFTAAQRDGVALARGAHWSPAGHALVAAALQPALRDLLHR